MFAFESFSDTVCIRYKGRIKFDSETFGTAELRQVYGINQAYQSDKSSLVAPRGVEPLLPG